MKILGKIFSLLGNQRSLGMMRWILMLKQVKEKGRAKSSTSANCEKILLLRIIFQKTATPNKLYT
jgi:hypothetical protein